MPGNHRLRVFLDHNGNVVFSQGFTQTPTVGTPVVMVGLVPTIHLSASSGARGTLEPRDKPEDDTGNIC